jgi:hypothetical protein
MAHSFFHLTAPRPSLAADNPLLGCTPEACETFYDEAQPLFEAVVRAIAVYHAAHPALSLTACYLAVDMVREILQADLRVADADA